MVFGSSVDQCPPRSVAPERRGLTQSLLELTEVFQSLLTTALRLLRRERGCRAGGGRSNRRVQAHVADLEVLLESVGWQQIGQLEGADVATAFANLPL